MTSAAPEAALPDIPPWDLSHKGLLKKRDQVRVLWRVRRKEWEREFLEEEGLLKMLVSLASGPFGGLPRVVTTRPSPGRRGFGGGGPNGPMVILLLSELRSLRPDLGLPGLTAPGGRHSQE